MKLILASLFAFLFLGINLQAQTTATDFDVKDCNGLSRHLFQDLDSGKVVVLSMVHPCASCVNPTKTALSIVNSYSGSHPGRVLFYLTDDDGGTACSSLLSWAATYGINGVPVISDTKVKQSDYGSSGMPKILVLGGSAHQVYFNQDNGLNTTNFTNAINTALATSGGSELKLFQNLLVFPNPAKENIHISLTLQKESELTISLYALNGKSKGMREVSSLLAGDNLLNIPLDDLANGLYVLDLKMNDQIYRKKILINR